MDYFIPPELEQSLSTVLLVHFVVASSLNSLAIYCLLRETPPNQSSIRSYLLSIQAIIFFFDLQLDVLVKPMPLFPAPAVYFVGVLSSAGAPTQLILVSSAICAGAMLMSAINLCFLHKHQSIVDSSSMFKLGRNVYWLVRLFYVAICISSFANIMLRPLDQYHSDMAMSTYTFNLTWVKTRGKYYVLENNAATRIAAYFFLMTTMLSLLLTNTCSTHIFYFLHAQKSKRSVATRTMIKRSVVALYIQLFAPSIFLGTPLFVDFFALATDTGSFNKLGSQNETARADFSSLDIIHTYYLLRLSSALVSGDKMMSAVSMNYADHYTHVIVALMNTSSMLSYYSVTSETPNISLGVILNTLLLYLITNFSNAYLGNYKYLLAIFASYDVFLSVLHGLLNPVVMVIGNTFGAALYAPWQYHEICSFYFACFSLPFSLMNIHFLYRFWSVANPSRLKLFSKAKFVAKLCVYPAVQGTMWFFCAYAIRTDADDIALVGIKSVFFENHNASIEDGWLVMDHWRNGELNVPVVYVIIVTMFIIFGSLFLSIALATLTYREILKATTLSNKLISIQYTLLVAVCAQTFVPVCCVYIPYFLIIMCPFLRFGLVNNFSYLVSVFPGWDAVVIIILIRDYRQGLLKLLGLRRKKKTIFVKHTQFTTSVQPTMSF